MILVAMIVPSACNDAQPGDIAKVVLMPGDPLRAKTLAETYLENPVCFNTIRNMYGYTGMYRGKRISVMEKCSCPPSYKTSISTSTNARIRIS